MGESDEEYFARRAEEEMQAALSAKDEASAAVHRELAERFTKLSRKEPEDKRPKLGLRLSGSN